MLTLVGYAMSFAGTKRWFAVTKRWFAGTKRWFVGSKRKNGLSVDVAHQRCEWKRQQKIVVTIERPLRIRALIYVPCQLADAMGSIGASGIGLMLRNVENKLINKGKCTRVSLMSQVHFPLFIFRRKWLLIVNEAARQVGEGFDAAIA